MVGVLTFLSWGVAGATGGSWRGTGYIFDDKVGCVEGCLCSRGIGGDKCVLMALWLFVETTLAMQSLVSLVSGKSLVGCCDGTSQGIRPTYSCPCPTDLGQPCRCT